MKNLMRFIFLSALVLGVAACSHDDDSCNPNVTFVGVERYSESVPPLGSDGRLIIPPNSPELSRSSDFKFVINSTGQVIDIDDDSTNNDDDDEITSIIDFNQMKLIAGDLSVGFSPNIELTNLVGRNVYQVNSPELHSKFASEVDFSEMSSEDATFCSFDSIEMQFAYDKNDSSVEYKTSTKFSYRLSQRILDFYRINAGTSPD